MRPHDKLAAKLTAYLSAHPGADLSEVQRAHHWTRHTAMRAEDVLVRRREIVQRGVGLWLREDKRSPYYKQDHAPLKMPNLRELLLEKVRYTESEGSMHSRYLDELRALPTRERTPGQQRDLDLAAHRVRVHEALVEFTESLLRKAARVERLEALRAAVLTEHTGKLSGCEVCKAVVACEAQEEQEPCENKN